MAQDIHKEIVAISKSRSIQHARFSMNLGKKIISSGRDFDFPRKARNRLRVYCNKKYLNNYPQEANKLQKIIENQQWLQNDGYSHLNSI